MSRIFIFLVSLFICMSSASAFGFGKATLHSYLDEPLKVSIPVSLEFKDSVLSSAIRIATPEEYLALHVFYNKAIPDININIEKTGKHTAVAYVTSTVNITEPIVNVLLYSKGSDGSSHFKKFTLLVNSKYTPKDKGRRNRPVMRYY